VEGGPTAFSVAHSLPAQSPWWMMWMAGKLWPKAEHQELQSIFPSKDPTGWNWLVLAGLSLISI